MLAILTPKLLRNAYGSGGYIDAYATLVWIDSNAVNALARTRKGDEMTLTSILNDTARATETEIKREYCGSIYWIRKCGNQWIVTADGAAICSP